MLTMAEEAKKEEVKQEDYSNRPWEKAALYLGAFFIDANTNLELGSGGANIKIDGEEALGLDENFTVFRGDAFWRITRRNRVDFTYYSMNRDGTNTRNLDYSGGDDFLSEIDISYGGVLAFAKFYF